MSSSETAAARCAVLRRSTRSRSYRKDIPAPTANESRNSRVSFAMVIPVIIYRKILAKNPPLTAGWSA